MAVEKVKSAVVPAKKAVASITPKLTSEKKPAQTEEEKQAIGAKAAPTDAKGKKAKTKPSANAAKKSPSKAKKAVAKK